MTDEVKNEAEEGKPKKGLSTVKIVLLSVILSSFVGGGLVGLTVYLLSDNDSSQVTAAKDVEQDDDAAEEEVEDKKNDGPVQYHQMDPKFVVSFSDKSVARFMQFSLQVMTRDDEVIEQLKLHNPAIRSNLVLLFNNQDASVMNTRDGKEALLTQITDDINKSLNELADISGVEAAYFDSFLIQ